MRRRGRCKCIARPLHGKEDPHGLPDRDFDTIFTRDKPVIFAYHGYPWLIHLLTYRRTNTGMTYRKFATGSGMTTDPSALQQQAV
ncbi:MAG: hypothetical protein KDI16_14270 [Halioglobus sp.]|nr:hypothetical protein [Halioglobus sp.]